MKFVQWLKDTCQYLFKGVSRLFSPTDDNYPKSGIQAFHGDIPKNSNQYY